MGEDKIGQGKENAVTFIEQNPEIAANIEAKVRELVFPGQVIEKKEPAKKAGKKAEKAAEAPAADAPENGALF